MIIDNILRNLEGVRKNGTGWIARCPAHDDKIASLAVGLGDDGRVLLHCHAGCTFESITSALGLEPKDLFLDRQEGSSKLTEIARYTYTDELGKPLFQVRRYLPKTFRQFCFDGNSGWIAGLNETRRVLYQLPEVIKSPIVYVVEGEKDVEMLRAWKIQATTNPGGASKWRLEYSEFLRGKSVVIIPDRDPQGEKHGHEVAHSLWGKATAIKVIHLPQGKDVSEWKELGGQREDLEKIVKQTPLLQTPLEPAETASLNLISLKDLLAEPEEQFDYLVDDLLPVGGLSLLVAKPKTGKSTLARQLTLAVGRGETFLGKGTHRGLAIYLALEERRSDVRSHFRKMGATGEEDLKIFAGMSPLDGLQLLRKTAEQEKPSLIVVDTLARLVKFKDMNDYAPVVLGLEPLLALAREVGSHVLLLHHAKKGDGKGIDSVLGSTGLAGSVDTIINLHRGEDYRTISSIQRDGNDLPETVLQFDTETRMITLGGSKEQTEIDELKASITGFLADQGEAVPEKIIDESVEGKRSYRKKALRHLVEEGRVARSGKGAKGDPYLYSGILVPAIPREPEYQNPRNSLTTQESRSNSGSSNLPLFDSSSPSIKGTGNQNFGPHREGNLGENQPIPQAVQTALDIFPGAKVEVLE